MKCDRCKYENPDMINFCPNCGASLNTQTVSVDENNNVNNSANLNGKNKNNKLLLVIILIIVILIAGVVICLVINKTNSNDINDNNITDNNTDNSSYIDSAKAEGTVLKNAFVFTTNIKNPSQFATIFSKRKNMNLTSDEANKMDTTIHTKANYVEKSYKIKDRTFNSYYCTYGADCYELFASEFANLDSIVIVYKEDEDEIYQVKNLIKKVSLIGIKRVAIYIDSDSEEYSSIEEIKTYLSEYNYGSNTPIIEGNINNEKGFDELEDQMYNWLTKKSDIKTTRTKHVKTYLYEYSSVFQEGTKYAITETIDVEIELSGKTYTGKLIIGQNDDSLMPGADGEYEVEFDEYVDLGVGSYFTIKYNNKIINTAVVTKVY